MAAGAIALFPAIAGVGAVAGTAGLALSLLGATSLLTGGAALGGRLAATPGDASLDRFLDNADRVSLYTGVANLVGTLGPSALRAGGRFFTPVTSAAERAAAAAAEAGAANRAAFEQSFSQSTERVLRIARSEGAIFEQGFAPRGSAKNFQSYVEANDPSLFVGSSRSTAILDNPSFAQPGRRVYEIDTRYHLMGVDANDYYAMRGMTNPFAAENELAMAGGVPRQAIINAREILPGGGLGNPIPNPYATSRARCSSSPGQRRTSASRASPRIRRSRCAST